MRPKEVWDKTQDPDGGAGGPRRRASQAKRGNSGSISYHSAGEDGSGGSAFFSDGSSPADANKHTSESQAPQLPAARRPRASSVQDGRLKLNGTKLNECSAAAALQRAIQSSPVRCRGVQHLEAAGKNLTPRPTRTRRVLFPSPTQQDQRQSSQGNVFDSRRNHSRPLDHDNLDSADKENMPPQQDDDERPIFDELPQRSVTPTPTSQPRDMPFKTPNRSVTPDRIVPTTGDFFSSAAKALLRPQTTPKHAASRPNASQPLGEISPFTAQVNTILSGADFPSPSGSQFEFPSLPSLSNTPHRIRHDFDFSQFDPQDLLSADVPMASSPPVEGWFGVYEDPAERDGNFWSDYPFPASSSPATASQSSSTKKTQTPTALAVDDSGRARLGFSAMAGGSG